MFSRPFLISSVVIVLFEDIKIQFIDQLVNWFYLDAINSKLIFIIYSYFIMRIYLFVFTFTVDSYR